MQEVTAAYSWVNKSSQQLITNKIFRMFGGLAEFNSSCRQMGTDVSIEGNKKSKANIGTWFRAVVDIEIHHAVIV